MYTPSLSHHTSSFLQSLALLRQKLQLTMKSILALLSLAALTAAVPVANPVAAPVDIDAIAELETRQLGGTTANNFVDGGCRDVIFMFARGSTEPGNMVRTFRKLKIPAAHTSPTSAAPYFLSWLLQEHCYNQQYFHTIKRH